MDRKSFIKKTLTLLEEQSEKWDQVDNPRDMIRKNLAPDDLMKTMDLTIRKKGEPDDVIMQSLEKIMALSVNTGSKMFMNQMYGHVNEAAMAGDWITTLLNTSMYTYEVAPLLTLIEMECINTLSTMVWPEGGDGVMTPGGSISNMEAIVFARNRLYPDSPAKGIPDGEKPAIFVSDQAHYSFRKGAVFLGIGMESVIEVPTDEEGRIIPDELSAAIETALENGMTPMMTVGIAGTTIAGFFDDLNAVADIARTYDMWYHVDAVYGGSLLFSPETRPLLNGIEQADSVSWNLHKISGIPIVCSVILTREKGVLNETFSIDADYLFHEEDADIDMGLKSIQCGRRVDALKLWLAMKRDGMEGFSWRVEELMQGARTLAKQVKDNIELELYQEPESPIVLFRYKGDVPDELLDQLNREIRNHIFREGQILFNYTRIVDKTWIRCVISNPDFGILDAARIIRDFLDTAEIVKKREVFQLEDL